jgi:hypothetical protein
MNERRDDLRRELTREAQDDEAKQAIKGLRWLLLHRRDNLEKDAAGRLKHSLALNNCSWLLRPSIARGTSSARLMSRSIVLPLGRFVGELYSSCFFP